MSIFGWFWRHSIPSIPPQQAASFQYSQDGADLVPFAEKTPPYMPDLTTVAVEAQYLQSAQFDQDHAAAIRDDDLDCDDDLMDRADDDDELGL